MKYEVWTTRETVIGSQLETRISVSECLHRDAVKAIDAFGEGYALVAVVNGQRIPVDSPLYNGLSRNY